jgi:hypothetical protein
MSTRERWIVYPLLFLTLGIAMRDKILPAARIQVGEITAGQIRCNELQVAKETASEQIHCNQLQVGQVVCNRLQSVGGIDAVGVQCREFQVVGSNGLPTVIVGTDPTSRGGLITTFSSIGAPLVCLQPSDSGGKVIMDAVGRWEHEKKGGKASPERPKTPPDRLPKQPSKGPERTAPKASS